MRNHDFLSAPDTPLAIYPNAELMRARATLLFHVGVIDWHLDGRDRIAAGEAKEFSFLESLLDAGLTAAQLPALLTTLERPYYYDHSEIYYDFSQRRWQQIPTAMRPSEVTDPDAPLPPGHVLPIYNSFTHYTIGHTPQHYRYHDVFTGEDDPQHHPEYFTLLTVFPEPGKKVRKLRFGEVIRVG